MLGKNLMITSSLRTPSLKRFGKEILTYVLVAITLCHDTSLQLFDPKMEEKLKYKLGKLL